MNQRRNWGDTNKRAMLIASMQWRLSNRQRANVIGVPFDPGFFACTSPNQWAHSSSYNHVPTSYEAFDLQYYIGGTLGKEGKVAKYEYWLGGGGSSSGGGGADGVAGGLLKLREDVLACGYEDVQVMWKMLHGSPSETTTFEEVSSHPPEVISHPAKCSKRRSWRAFFWSIHRTCSPSSAHLE